jgi:hypothetical protein
MGILDTDCPECIKRREEIAAWMEAVKKWTLKPFGPMPAPPVHGMKLVKESEEKPENTA